jgi:hypothetical protein
LSIAYRVCFPLTLTLSPEGERDEEDAYIFLELFVGRGRVYPPPVIPYDLILLLLS